VALALVALVGLRLYLDTQWYVGVSDGHVAIFRGIPTEVAGFELHHVVVETTISAQKAESLVVYRDLGDGRTAEDREGASAIVEQIRQDVEQMGQLPQSNQPSSTNASGP
jgi:protein phosphatase